MAWFAHSLAEESQEIALSILQSNWYEADHDCKKLFLIIIARSQKPLYLTLGGAANLDLDIPFKVLKSVYSVMNLFLQNRSL